MPKLPTYMKINVVGLILANVLANLISVHAIRPEAIALCLIVCATVTLTSIASAPAYQSRMYLVTFYALLASCAVAYFNLNAGVYVLIIATTLIVLCTTYLHFLLSVRAVRNLSDDPR